MDRRKSSDCSEIITPNPKSTYHDIFAGSFPSEEEIKFFFVASYSIPEAVYDEKFIELIADDECVMDENVFVGIMEYLVQQRSTVSASRSLFLCKCSQCNKRKQSLGFVTAEHSMSVRCNECRKESVIDQIPRKIYFCGDLDSVDCSELSISDWQNVNYIGAVEMKSPLECVYSSW